MVEEFEEVQLQKLRFKGVTNPSMSGMSWSSGMLIQLLDLNSCFFRSPSRLSGSRNGTGSKSVSVLATLKSNWVHLDRDLINM